MPKRPPSYSSYSRTPCGQTQGTVRFVELDLSLRKAHAGSRVPAVEKGWKAMVHMRSGGFGPAAYFRRRSIVFAYGSLVGIKFAGKNTV